MKRFFFALIIITANLCSMEQSKKKRKKDTLSSLIRISECNSKLPLPDGTSTLTILTNKYLLEHDRIRKVITISFNRFLERDKYITLNKENNYYENVLTILTMLDDEVINEKKSYDKWLSIGETLWRTAFYKICPSKLKSSMKVIDNLMKG